MPEPRERRHDSSYRPMTTGGIAEAEIEVAGDGPLGDAAPGALLAIRIRQLGVRIAAGRATDPDVDRKRSPARCESAVEAERRVAGLLDEVRQLFAHAETDGKDWGDLLLAVAGPAGALARWFPDPTERETVECSDVLAEVWRSVARAIGTAPGEPAAVITVRLPKAAHAAIQADAFRLGVSMNRLALLRLSQPTRTDHV